MIAVIKRIIKKVLQIIFFMHPMKQNRIVFDNFGGKGYADNPKYIAEELNSRQLGLELVWLVKDKYKEDVPKYIKPVKFSSLKMLYMVATAKVLVDNSRGGYFHSKRKGQTYLQTWHGGLGVKKIEKDVADQLDSEYVKLAIEDGKRTDAVIVSCPWQEEMFKRCFWLNEDVEYLRTGLPRNDQLINDAKNEKKIKKLKKKYNIKPNAYYILYAPTFRDNGSVEGYKLDFNQIIKEVSNKFKKECYIIVKLHPSAINLANFIEYNEHIINGSEHTDILELSLICDCIISDFSSSIFDCVMLKKDGYVCALDYEEYINNRRIDEEMFKMQPFPVSYSNEQLINDIKNFNREEYLKKLDDFMKKNPIYDDGNASKKVADWILNKMKR